MGGNLQSCKVKRTLDERTFERIAILRLSPDYTVELHSIILVGIQYEISLSDGPHGSVFIDEPNPLMN